MTLRVGALRGRASLEDLVLLGLGQPDERPLESPERLGLERREGCQELAPGLTGVDAQQQVDEAADTGLGRTRHDALTEGGQRFVLMG